MMASLTEIGKKYKVTGNIGAWDNYTPANESDVHARGESTGSSLFSLTGKIITVVEQKHRVEEGYPEKEGGAYAPYEVVSVTLEGDDTKYYAWVVYDGVVQVEEYIEQQQEEQEEEILPDTEKEEAEDITPPPMPPDPPPIPPHPSGTEVVVKAGQTVVLDIKTSGQSEGPGTGSFEVTLVDVNGKPTAPGEKVYLVSEGGSTTYEVDINTDQQSSGYGTGKLPDIKTGQYTLSLEQPPLPIPPSGEEQEPIKWEENVYFSNGDYGVSTSGAMELEKIAKYLADEDQANVSEVRCVGYADNRGTGVNNMNLSIQRAASARKVLKEKLDVNMLNTTRAKPEIKSTGKGALPGDTEIMWAHNRRVDFFVERRAMWGQTQEVQKGTGNNVKPPTVPIIPSCLSDRSTWILSNINTMLGQSARNHAMMFKSQLITDTERRNYYDTDSNYQAFIPVGHLDNCFLIITSKINIYKKNPVIDPSRNDARLYVERFSDPQIFVGWLDNTIRLMHLRKIDEGVRDYNDNNAGGRNLDIGRSNVETDIINHYVYRHSLDTPNPSGSYPLSDIEIARGQIFTIHYNIAQHTLESLNEQFRNYLNRIVQHVANNVFISQVDCLGHTDNNPHTPSNNQQLSILRATAIYKHLRDNSNILNRISKGTLILSQPAGQGGSNPIRNNTTSIGQAYNRRVEIRIEWDYERAPSVN